jgi:TrmH family RNA methyltransferase
MATLSNAQAKIIRQLSSRHTRRKSPFFLVEGLTVAREALQRRPDWLEFAVVEEGCAEAADLVPGACTDGASRFSDLSQTENPQGIILVMRRPENVAVNIGDPFVLALDRVGDPGNLGTLMRTAWACGLQGVAVTNGTTDPFGPKAIRAGVGAQFALSIHFAADLQALWRGSGADKLYIADAHIGCSCFDDAFDIAGSVVAVSHETAGVSQIDGADRVTIPMPGNAESLNVSQAGTILMFEAVRRGLMG